MEQFMRFQQSDRHTLLLRLRQGMQADEIARLLLIFDSLPASDPSGAL